MRGFCYFILSILAQVSSSTVTVVGILGHNVTLPCQYDIETYGVQSFCWGRAKVPTFKCYNTVLTSADGAVEFRQSSRYQVLEAAAHGHVSLTILNAQRSDAGMYGCRVEIPGIFNDYKVNVELIIEEETASTSTMKTVGDPTFSALKAEATTEEFKASAGVENVGRVAVFFFFTIIIILAFIFRRRLLPRTVPEHLRTTTAENIYDSVQVE